MAKLLYGWGNKKYNQEYWKRIKENWKRWKRNPFFRYNRRMEEKRDKYKRGKIEEWNKKEDEEDQQRIEENRKYLEQLGDENQDMGNLRDPYDKL